MNRLDARFKSLKETNEKALVCYFPLGDPVAGNPLALATRYEAAGVDVLEMGLPWSDPTLDGPTIRASMARALAAGVTPWEYFRSVAAIREKFPDLALEVMTYPGWVDALGENGFARMCHEAGVDAVMVGGLAEEHRPVLEEALETHGIHLLRFAPFALTSETVEVLVQKARGYVFVQAKPGVTGVGSVVHPEVQTSLATLRSAGVKVPLVAGFGLGTPAQVRQVCEWGADGVVVGSAVVEHIIGGLDRASDYLTQLKHATRQC